MPNTHSKTHTNPEEFFKTNLLQKNSPQRFSIKKHEQKHNILTLTNTHTDTHFKQHCNWSATENKTLQKHLIPHFPLRFFGFQIKSTFLDAEV